MASDISSHRIQIVVAVIGVIGVISAATISNWDKIFPTDPAIADSSVQTETQNSKGKISSTYTDIEKKRVIQFKRISDNTYEIEEPGTAWPWKGEAEIIGSELSGWARFPKSKASMDVKGLINSDGSINVRYEYITKGDGTSANGRVDHHVWFPVE